MSVRKAFVDITGVTCPVTYVKVMAALDELTDGEALKVRLNDGEPIQNVPRSLKDDGHRVTSIEANADGTFVLTVVKDGIK